MKSGQFKDISRSVSTTRTTNVPASILACRNNPHHFPGHSPDYRSLPVTIYSKVYSCGFFMFISCPSPFRQRIVIECIEGFVLQTTFLTQNMAIFYLVYSTRLWMASIGCCMVEQFHPAEYTSKNNQKNKY